MLEWSSIRLFVWIDIENKDIIIVEFVVCF